MQTRSELLQEIERLEAQLKFVKADLADLDIEVIEYYNASYPETNMLWASLSGLEQQRWREELKRSKMTRTELLKENETLRKQLEEQSAYYAQQDERNRREEQYQLDRYAGQD